MGINPSLADVRARRAEISKTIASLQSEEKELAAVEDALVRLFGARGDEESVGELFDHADGAATADVGEDPSGDAGADDENNIVTYVSALLKGNETIEELITLLMQNCGDEWWTAAELRSHVSTLKGREIAMSTVSPMLWTMRNKGIITRQGMNVALTARLNNRAATK